MENKSLGGALVDVFDAAVTLVKSEITAIARRVGDIAKAKGLGVVLLLASLVPLTLALIFLILFVFYGLMRLGLGAWAAALLIGLLSLIVTAGLIFMGLKKLGSDVPDANDPGKLSDIAKDDLKYGSAPTNPGGQTAGSGAGVSVNGPDMMGGVSRSGTTDRAEKAAPEQGHTTGGHPVESAHAGAVQASTRTITTRAPEVTSTAPQSSASAAPAQPNTVQSNTAQVTSAQSTSAQSTSAQSTSTQGKPTNEHDAGRSEQTGIEVSTHPTYRDDMKKEGY